MSPTGRGVSNLNSESVATDVHGSIRTAEVASAEFRDHELLLQATRLRLVRLSVTLSVGAVAGRLANLEE